MYSHVLDPNKNIGPKVNPGMSVSQCHILGQLPNPLIRNKTQDRTRSLYNGITEKMELKLGLISYSSEAVIEICFAALTERLTLGKKFLWISIL